MKVFAKTLMTFAAASALALGQAKPAADPMIQSSHTLFTQISQFILRSAEKIPENLYSYRPTPEVRTIGQLFGHIADASNHICAAAMGGQRAPGSVEQTVKTKAGLIASLKREFAGCDADYAKLTPSSAMETISFEGMTLTRVAAMDYEVAHTWEHYGNLVTYMRLNKIVPPSSEPQK
ncbi:MAG TPA: DinB family protein [Bryobacteraceae bacterium]|nr:DinB family protein [Bryobacteraceae bacterium]